MDVITVFLNISLAYLPGYRLLFHILLQISELDRRAICAAVKHDDEQISLSTCKRGASVSRKRKTSRTFLHDSELAASCWSSRKDSLQVLYILRFFWSSSTATTLTDLTCRGSPLLLRSKRLQPPTRRRRRGLRAPETLLACLVDRAVRVRFVGRQQKQN